MFTFFDILSISVNALGVQLTPHVQNFKTPLLPPFTLSHPHHFSQFHPNLTQKNIQNTQNEFENEFEQPLIK